MAVSKRALRRATLTLASCGLHQPLMAQSIPAQTSPVQPYPAQANGDGVTTGGYNLSRWAEDWTQYRDPTRSDDAIDRLKYLPLDRDGDVYLTLSGEARLRINHTSNPNLRESQAQRQDINRLVAGADLHVGRHVRLYGEIAHGGIAGVNLGAPSGSLRNDLIVQQSFVELKGNVAGVALGARYGRQEFTDGPNLLVSQRDNNTIRYVLNGWRAWARTGGVRIDMFDFKPTSLGHGGTGDDRSDDDRRFSGFTAGIVIPEQALGGSKLYLDPFVWRLRTSDAQWGKAVAREERYFTGARLWGEAGRFTIDWTVNHQHGRQGGRAIDAWQILLAQNYKLAGLPLAPRISLHVDHASGGGSYTGGKLRAAYAPFGNNIYYSYQLYLTPTNLQTITPGLMLAPARTVKAQVEYQFAWRPDQRDAVYRANGSAFAGTELVDGHKVAESLRAQLVWAITPRLSVTGRYEHLAAGPVLRKAGYSSSDFFGGWLSFRF